LRDIQIVNVSDGHGLLRVIMRRRRRASRGCGSQSELARRLKVRETVVRRMLDPNHDTRPEKIQAALEALGKRVVMAYDDAA
jgi:ribosome-binding protein aMBF1 (putative translation factor)